MSQTGNPAGQRRWSKGFSDVPAWAAGTQILGLEKLIAIFPEPLAMLNRKEPLFISSNHFT